MKLIEYLPSFLQEIREFKELFQAEDIEVENLNKAINGVTDEVIIKNAKNYGLERYEKLYKIKKISEDVEIRRMNILLKINQNSIFTLKYLQKYLEEVLGKNKFYIDVIYNEYLLILKVSLEFSDFLTRYKKELRKIIQANLELELRLFSNIDLASGFNVRKKEYITLTEREE